MENETDIDPGTEAPAIRTLGSLFKITRVFLWEGASSDAPELFSASAHYDGVEEEDTNLHGPAVSTASSSGVDSTISAFTVSLEDIELVRQMNGLGLPVSFSTNKEKKTVTTKKKRRSIPQKSLSGHELIQDQLRDDFRVSEEESCIHPIVCQDNTKTFCITNGQHDTSYCCFAEDDCKQQFLSVEGDYVGSTAQALTATGQDRVCREITGVAKLYDASQANVLDFTPKNNTGSTVNLCPTDAENFLQNAFQDSFSGHEHEESDQNPMKVENLEGYDTGDENADAKKICDNSGEKVFISEPAEPSQSSDHLGGSLQEEYDSCKSCSDLGDWRVIWDDFYTRNYFYNIRTHESTWYPPPGMESFAFSDSAAELGETIVDVSENHGAPELSCSDTKVLDVHGSNDNNQLLQEAQNDDRLSSQSSLTVISSMEHATANCMLYLTPPTACSTSIHSDKLEANINCFEIKRNSDDDLYPVHSCSFPDTQEPVDSLPNICNELGSGEVLSSEPQPLLMNSKTDELDAFDHFDEPEVSATSMEAVELSEDSPLQVLDGERSITPVTEVCCKETEKSDVPLTCLPSREDEVDGHCDFANPKRKKKANTRSRKKKLSTDKQELSLQGMLEGFSVDTVKYWCQRYLLFSRFDDGIKMDEEGWFSVTPEPIARHQASRCGSGTIIDCFTGVGGNAIQFAKRCNHVIAIDIDPQRINYAQHNATIYGVRENIDFIKGDFFHLAPKLKGDTVFMSPPWGGPDYAKVQTYDIGIMLKPRDGYFLFKTASEIASRIVMFLPRNVDLNQLAELSLLANPPWSLEVEKNFLNGKLKAITAYFKDVSLEAAKSFCL